MGRLGPLQHIARAVGLETAAMAEKGRQAGKWRAGHLGEKATARIVAPLAHEGWMLLHDLRIWDRANLDHVLVAPDTQVLLLDSKWWSVSAPVRLSGRHVLYQSADVTDEVAKVGRLADGVEELLRVPVTPLVVPHNAPVQPGIGFTLPGTTPVHVVPPERLLTVLRGNVGRPNPGAARALAERVAVVLPEYR
ncbi:nuclease-related domain-containing protein [Streptomyces sp. NPDC059740]|uniref:nuclease-related domain-containing protein n=1 Tax=Streptomyces sp. NPDC059740 TaxID=3346926 RepID=UPI003667DB74